ncbi:hypothetical protein B0H19DRAFT_1250162 [Mycena capillaripes]|nr:hypothetical protein B0H19DRAFT_1250162 [Mycena capillaripes]
MSSIPTPSMSSTAPSTAPSPPSLVHVTSPLPPAPSHVDVSIQTSEVPDTAPLNAYADSATSIKTPAATPLRIQFSLIPYYVLMLGLVYARRYLALSHYTGWLFFTDLWLWSVYPHGAAHSENFDATGWAGLEASANWDAVAPEDMTHTAAVLAVIALTQVLCALLAAHEEDLRGLFPSFLHVCRILSVGFALHSFLVPQRFYSVYDTTNSQLGFATTQHTMAPRPVCGLPND